MKKNFYRSIFAIVIICTSLSPSIFLDAKPDKKMGGFNFYPIEDNVYRIEENVSISIDFNGTTYSGYYLVNIYVIELNDTLILVDTGVEDYGKNLKHFIKQNFGNKKIEAILLTHAHADHAGGGRFFLNGNTKLYANESDWSSIINGMSDAYRSDFTYTGYSPTNTYADFNLTNFNVTNTPGHTNGSICVAYLTTGDHQVLFTGDTTISMHDISDTNMTGQDLTFALEFFTLWLGTDSIELQNSSLNYLCWLSGVMSSPIICPGHKETNEELDIGASEYLANSVFWINLAILSPNPPDL